MANCPERNVTLTDEVHLLKRTVGILWNVKGKFSFMWKWTGCLHTWRKRGDQSSTSSSIPMLFPEPRPPRHPRTATNEFTVTYQFGVMHRLTRAYSTGANNIYSPLKACQDEPLDCSIHRCLSGDTPPPTPRPWAVELHNLMTPVSVQQTNEVHVFCIQWRVGQYVLERYCPQHDGRPLCHCLPVQQRGMFMVICTYLCTQSRMSTCLCAWVNHYSCGKKSGRAGKGKNKGKTQQWEAHLMWSVCKQIAVFYVNLNLSCSASYQACWQHGAYLSCWQDERGDREGEREKTCQRWLITSQPNSWVLCLHLDSRVRLRWASLIRIFFYFFFSARALLGL